MKIARGLGGAAHLLRLCLGGVGAMSTHWPQEQAVHRAELCRAWLNPGGHGRSIEGRRSRGHDALDHPLLARCQRQRRQ